MSTSIQEVTVKLAKEAVIEVGVILDSPDVANQDALLIVLGKLADIIVLNER